MPQVVAVISSFNDEAAGRKADHEKHQRQRNRKEEERLHSLRNFLVTRTDVLSAGESLLGLYECVLGSTHKRKTELTERIFNCSNNMSQTGQEEGEQMQRPDVRDEDLTEAKGKLGASGPAKSKTFEVMEECEKIGKAAPSVFSNVRSGGETVLNTRPARPIRK